MYVLTPHVLFVWCLSWWKVIDVLWWCVCLTLGVRFIIYYYIVIYYIIYYTLLSFHSSPLPHLSSYSSFFFSSLLPFPFPSSLLIFLIYHSSFPSFILYLSILIYTYLYSRLINNLTPHVLSEDWEDGV